MRVIDMDLNTVWQEYKDLHYGENWAVLGHQTRLEIEAVFKCSIAYTFNLLTKICEAEDSAPYTFCNLVRQSEDYLKGLQNIET